MVPTSTWHLLAVGGRATLAQAAGRLRAEAGRLRIAGPSARPFFAEGGAVKPMAGRLSAPAAEGAGQGRNVRVQGPASLAPVRHFSQGAGR